MAVLAVPTKVISEQCPELPGLAHGNKPHRGTEHLDRYSPSRPSASKLSVKKLKILQI